MAISKMNVPLGTGGRVSWQAVGKRARETRIAAMFLCGETEGSKQRKWAETNQVRNYLTHKWFLNKQPDLTITMELPRIMKHKSLSTWNPATNDQNTNYSILFHLYADLLIVEQRKLYLTNIGGEIELEDKRKTLIVRDE